MPNNKLGVFAVRYEIWFFCNISESPYPHVLCCKEHIKRGGSVYCILTKHGCLAIFMSLVTYVSHITKALKKL